METANKYLLKLVKLVANVIAIGVVFLLALVVICLTPFIVSTIIAYKFSRSKLNFQKKDEVEVEIIEPSELEPEDDGTFRNYDVPAFQEFIMKALDDHQKIIEESAEMERKATTPDRSEYYN